MPLVWQTHAMPLLPHCSRTTLAYDVVADALTPCSPMVTHYMHQMLDYERDSGDLRPSLGRG